MQHHCFRFSAVILLLLAGCPSSSAPSRISLDVIGLDEDSLAGRDLVVLKFGAEWCPPCRMVDQSLDQLKESHGASVVVQKIDIGEEPSLASQFGVRGIPRIFLLRDGEVIDDITGSRTHSDLAKWVENEGAIAGPDPGGRTRENPYGDDIETQVMPVNLTPKNEPTNGKRLGIRSNPFAST